MNREAVESLVKSTPVELVLTFSARLEGLGAQNVALKARIADRSPVLAAQDCRRRPPEVRPERGQG